MPATPPWLAAAEAMLNRSIDASSQATELARRLDTHSLRFEVDGWMKVRAAVHGGRLSLASADAEEADAVITGSVQALLSMLRAARPTAGEERATVTIRGDAEVANLYRQLFLAARPDPEEELSRWIGDAPARTVSRLAGGVIGWARRTHRVFGENLAEYLQEESRDLVTKPEVEEFLEGVDQVRESADRVEARLQALQQRLRDKA
jgi:ubiquinone biosynthesis accessory factor UbiJ